MPPVTKQEEAPLLRKSYLIGLGVAAIIALLLSGSRLWDMASAWFKSSEAPSVIRIERGASGSLENLAATNKELAVFQNWLSGADVPVIVIRKPVEIADNTPGRDPERKKTVRAVWPVPIQGTTYSRDGWVAFCADGKLKPGNVIYPSEKLCGYQVVGVTRRCVWLLAFLSDKPSEENYSGVWPDIGGVRMGLQKPFAPESVELKSGEFVSCNDVIVFGNGARLTVLDLWPRGAHFRLQSPNGAKPLELVCIVVN